MKRSLYILVVLIATQCITPAQELQLNGTARTVDDENGFIISYWTVASQRPFDRYGEIPEWEERVRLDSFALELLQKPDLVGYIIARSKPGEDSLKSDERLEQAKKYITSAYSIEDDRIITIAQCGQGATEFRLRIDSPGKFLTNSPPTVILEAKVNGN